MISPTILIFDPTTFRLQFPEFTSVTVFPDVRLQMYWDMATSYISDVGNYGWLQGVDRQLALNLMTAHLLQLSIMMVNGTVVTPPGMVTSSTIDKISVSLTPPPFPNQWQWWLGLTGYGQMLLALLQAHAAGGDYIGGLPELSAFRRVAGIFTCD